MVIYKGCHSSWRNIQSSNILVNMKLVLILAALIGFACCRPQDRFQLASPIYITRYINDFLPFQNYFYIYEQSDGQKKEESGSYVEETNPDESYFAVKGSYSYVGDDGQNYNVSYTADKDGFQPEGEHIPPSAGVKPKLGISGAALASLSG
ncbi:hypothetical protein WA026_003508 [Henosepilachna vigintioctopunctata]|uniref:Uncharacterized protein n=1 Tax=Henosepilachna vigintioctopunctata TaxID=420089 RepID=A0AAW1TPU5_9CUCU